MSLKEKFRKSLITKELDESQTLENKQFELSLINTKINNAKDELNNLNIEIENAKNKLDILNKELNQKHIYLPMSIETTEILNNVNKYYIYGINPKFNLWYSMISSNKIIEEYCKLNNIVVTDEYFDDNGYSLDEQPELQKLLTKLKKDDVMICSTVTQISWNLEQLLKIKRIIYKQKAKLIILDNPSSISTLTGEYHISLTMAMDKYRINRIESEDNKLYIQGTNY